MNGSVQPDGFDEVGALELVLVRRPEQAFADAAAIECQWLQLNYPSPPDFAKAINEYDRFVDLLQGIGARVEALPRGERIGLDSIYVRDAAIVAPGGMILCSMGKTARRDEPDAALCAFQELGVPVKGRIDGEGRLEGGDLVWLDSRTVIVGQGYRSNGEGISQLKTLLGEEITVEVVPLPHWRGEDDVFHLMSVLSPIDRDLMLVYSPLLPVPFRQWLIARDIRLVEVPDEEFESMGCNVLSLAPSRCLMLAGNYRTRAALERAGVEVLEYEGNEISVKGAGGPTCLTRPIRRHG